MKKRIYTFAGTFECHYYLDFIKEGDSDFYIRSRSEDGIETDKVNFERFQRELQNVKESGNFVLLHVTRK